MPFAEPGANILEISYSKLGISDQIIRQLQFTTDLKGVLLRIQGSDGQDQLRALSLSDFYNSNSDPIHLVDLTRTSNREIVHFDWSSQTLIRQVVTQSDHQNIIIQNAHKKINPSRLPSREYLGNWIQRKTVFLYLNNPEKMMRWNRH